MISSYWKNAADSAICQGRIVGSVDGRGCEPRVGLAVPTVSLGSVGDLSSVYSLKIQMSRKVATMMKRIRRANNGPQSNLATRRAEAVRAASAISCATATTTVLTTITALAGDSATISIGLKLYLRFQPFDPPVEQATHYAGVVADSI